jgi:nucleoside-triphosphatase THEP1
VSYSEENTLDEISFLESKAQKFTREIFRILDSSKVVFEVIKGRECEYINKVCSREDIIILKVIDENVEEMKEQVIDILRKWDIPFK